LPITAGQDLYTYIALFNTRQHVVLSSKQVLAIVILSVRLSVCLSITTRYRFKPMWDVETLGFHRMIA